MSTICEEIHRELIRLETDPTKIEHISLSNQGHAELRNPIDLSAYFSYDEIVQAPFFLGVELIVDASQQERFIVQERDRQN